MDKHDEEAERVLPCVWGQYFTPPRDCDSCYACTHRPAVAALLRERDAEIEAANREADRFMEMWGQEKAEVTELRAEVAKLEEFALTSAEYIAALRDEIAKLTAERDALRRKYEVPVSLSMEATCQFCGVDKDEHNHEHLARECYPIQIRQLKAECDAAVVQGLRIGAEFANDSKLLALKAGAGEHARVAATIQDRIERVIAARTAKADNEPR